MKTLVAFLLIVLLSACAKEESQPAPSLDGVWMTQEIRQADGTVSTSSAMLSIDGSKWRFGELAGPTESGTLTRQGNTITNTTPNGKSTSLDIIELTNERLVLQSTDGKQRATYKRLGGDIPRKFSPAPVP